MVAPGRTRRATGCDCSAAQADQPMREQTIRVAFDQVLLHQAIVPRRWNGTHTVVRSGELSTDRGDYVRVTTNVCGAQYSIAEIVRRAECPERSGKGCGSGIVHMRSRLGD